MRRLKINKMAANFHVSSFFPVADAWAEGTTVRQSDAERINGILIVTESDRQISHTRRELRHEPEGWRRHLQPTWVWTGEVAAVLRTAVAAAQVAIIVRDAWEARSDDKAPRVVFRDRQPSRSPKASEASHTPWDADGNRQTLQPVRWLSLARKLIRGAPGGWDPNSSQVPELSDAERARTVVQIMARAEELRRLRQHASRSRPSSDAASPSTSPSTSAATGWTPAATPAPETSGATSEQESDKPGRPLGQRHRRWHWLLRRSVRPTDRTLSGRRQPPQGPPRKRPGPVLGALAELLHGLRQLLDRWRH